MTIQVPSAKKPIPTLSLQFDDRFLFPRANTFTNTNLEYLLDFVYTSATCMAESSVSIISRLLSCI